MLCRSSTTLLFLLISFSVHAQVRIREYNRGFQLSIFPGISINGIYSGSYYNKFSLNIFGGLSAGSTLLEVGILTNVNLKKSNGIQLAGLANIVGSNAFVNLTLSEERELIRDGFESSFKGIQTAGFLNYVRSNFSGIQLGGLFNVVGVDATGFQFAGLGNGVRGYDYFQETWGFGYGFQKVLYNKFSVAPHKLNERKLITYGLRFIHLNRDLKFDKTFNLITRINLDYGIRWKSNFIFAGLSINYFLYQPEDENVYKINSLKIATGSVGELASSFWPGYNVGIQF